MSPKMASDTKKVIHIFRFKISCIRLGPIRALASFQGGCACLYECVYVGDIAPKYPK